MMNLPPAIRAIQNNLIGDTGDGGQLPDESLTVDQLMFRIEERDKRNRRVGHATLATTAAGVFYGLLRIFG